ncbi:B-cell CLL/lymphoma 6 member B protein-like protein [Leptotrombidium deliense]|uniref:B-cell CLL/lymphoma 6 member B protein-like protein n=1 Tax=Leptotrombidium deliense TaxID=299467 RepID=A0A443SWK1_9ACAR|nr:B-cell CLL/lymphoma 6 member B protein-like protein [Leptotrombidium deliense]
MSTASSPSAVHCAQRPLRLRRVNHAEELVSGFARLLKSEAMSDVTLICAGGQSIRAHKVILSMFSPYFRAIFEAQPFANNPNNYPVIVMKDLGVHELKTIVEFIYRGEASVPRDKLNSILQAAKALEVSGLSDLKDSNSSPHVSSPSSSDSTTSPTPVSTSGNFAPISGALTGVGALGGNSLSVSGPGYKRNQDVESTTIFGGTGPDPQLKKLRITLDNGNELSNSIDLGAGFVSGFGATGGGVVINDGPIEGVRSLLQQPPRLPATFQQQVRQQQQLFQQQMQMQKRQLSLQQYMQQRQVQQRQQLQQRQMHLQQQQQQILQQQLLQKGLKHFPVVKGSQGTKLVHYQQRIQAQLNEKQPRITFTQTSSTLQERLLQKPVSQKLKALQELKAKQDAEAKKDANDSSKEKDENCANGQEKDKQDGESKKSDDSSNDDALSSALKSDAKNTSKEENNNETVNENDENEEPQGTDPEGSNSSRTGSGSGNGGNHNESKNIDDAAEDENQLSVAGGVEEGLQQANEGNTGNEENEDNGTGFGFDWQEGFIDDGFVPPNETAEQQLALPPPPQTTPTATPDFLQPRGPGRPRKGNKSTEISPCPECNKVFVRPDVLKLHYRSVHLNERHPCNLCPKIFKWPGDLSKHKRTKHPEATLAS